MRFRDPERERRDAEHLRDYMKAGRPRQVAVPLTPEPEANRQIRLREEQRQAERSDEAMARKRAEAEAWHRKRNEEFQPFKAKLAELEQIAKSDGPINGALDRGDLEAAITARLRKEAAARLVPYFKDRLAARFATGQPIHVERVR